MALTSNEQRINELFEELVPPQGKAGTVAGEIIRAVCRIHYRNWNDGDHIGVGYGRETCNAAARYLQTVGNDEMREIINAQSRRARHPLRCRRSRLEGTPRTGAGDN